jgi:hypothetical protein
LPAPHRQNRIDARVAAPEPHDFAVRRERFVCTAYTALTPQASIATRTTLRDDRETSLMPARAGYLLPQIRIPVKRNLFNFGLDRPNRYEITQEISFQAQRQVPDNRRSVT